MAEVINQTLIPKIKLSSGEEIPCVGMGTFGSDRFTAEQVSNAVAGAIRCGYRMFDCAACYQNEDQIGEVFKAAFDEGVVERKDLFIMTKVWNDMHREVEKACRKQTMCRQNFWSRALLLQKRILKALKKNSARWLLTQRLWQCPEAFQKA